jgi:hypothetical protein
MARRMPHQPLQLETSSLVKTQKPEETPTDALGRSDIDLSPILRDVQEGIKALQPGRKSPALTS